MLPHVERVNTRDVDAWDNASDNLLESASQKSARLQKQLKLDRVKDKRRLVMSVETIEQKLTQTKAKLVSDKTKLDQLFTKRARLKLLNKPTEDVDDEIRPLKTDVDNVPYILTELESQLVAEQEKLNESCRNDNLNKQKLVAAEIEQLSKKMVSALSKAVDINGELHKANDIYCQLLKQTGQDILSTNVTQGSEEFLQYVYDYCQQELEGKRPSRTAFPPPCPRI